MANFDIVGAKTLLRMMVIVALSAFIATLFVVGAMMAVQDVGTPLIGSERWFIFWMLPTIFATLMITVFWYRKFAQEKIAFNY